MAIRFKKYKSKLDRSHVEVMAVKVTEANIPELVEHICRRGGAATGHITIPAKKGGKVRPARIRLRQRNFGKTWGKRDWRVAEVGDYIIRTENDEFYRDKGDEFERFFGA